MPEIPCHGDVFHIQQQFEQVANGLIRRVQGGPARLLKQAQQMASTSLKDIVEQKLFQQIVLDNFLFRKQFVGTCPVPKNCFLEQNRL